jgi:hypothetical protein
LGIFLFPSREEDAGDQTQENEPKGAVIGLWALIQNHKGRNSVETDDLVGRPFRKI